MFQSKQSIQLQRQSFIRTQASQLLPEQLISGVKMLAIEAAVTTHCPDTSTQTMCLKATCGAELHNLLNLQLNLHLLNFFCSNKMKRARDDTDDNPVEQAPKKAKLDESLIEGLSLIPDFITVTEEKELLTYIDAQKWSSSIGRRVQQYGFEYSYAALNKTPKPTNAIPDKLLAVAKRLTEQKLMPDLAEQLIVNEYTPGQGISPHFDHAVHFGAVISSVSLGSACVMDFKHRSTGETKSVVLEPRSALVLSGPSRYDWFHSIAKRRTDKIGTRVIQRGRRVSMTFRTMK